MVDEPVAELPALLFGSATDPVDITKGDAFRVQAALIMPLPFRVLAGTKVTITIENVATGLFYDGNGFHGTAPTQIRMESLGYANNHYFGLHEWKLPPTPGGAGVGDIIEAHMFVAKLSVTIARIRFVAPADFPHAKRRFPRRRKIPFTAVPSARMK